ncbi:MAG: acyltransferase [Clostridiales bacterium]|nr:acyltransferase [Clostridiales bacterium]
MENVTLRLRAYSLPPDEKHIDVLDGIRALMILLVGWFHICQQQGWLVPSLPWIGKLDYLLYSGYLWVDGMLLLSGFLLYLPYASGGKAPSILAFYKRRLIRILPSYLLCILPIFVICVLQGKYPDPSFAVKDILTHLTFTQTLFQDTYFSSPSNGALWTVAVEMQFYLIFPFLALAFRKKPAVTFLCMTLAAFGFRYYAFRLEDPSMFFNQMPAFLDVYACGFAAASAYAALRKRLGGKKWDRGVRLLFTVLFIVCVCQLMQLARRQAFDSNHLYGSIQRGQLVHRFPLAAALGCAMVCAACSLPSLRFALGNPVMRFLASVSFQFYIWHQLIAVQLRKWRFPPSAMDAPWDGDYGWQVRYTLVCFAAALAWATLVTYLFERPVARALRRKTRAEK